MSIKKLQQLGQSRPKLVEAPPRRNPVDYDNISFDEDDEWGGLDDEEELSNNKDIQSGALNQNTNKHVQKIKALDVDYDDFEDAPDSDQGIPKYGNKTPGNAVEGNRGSSSIYRPDSVGLYGQQKSGQLLKSRPRHPVDDDSDLDDDFGTKPANQARLDDDTPEQPIGLGNMNDDSDIDAIDFDPKGAIKKTKLQAELEILKEAEENKKKADSEQIKKREREKIESNIKQAEEEETKRRIREIEDRAKREKQIIEAKDKDQVEHISKKVQERVELSMSRNKNSSIGKGKDDSNAVSDDLNNFLGQIGGKKPDSFQLDDASYIASKKQVGGLAENKSFEEFDMQKNFENLDEEDDEP